MNKNTKQDLQISQENVSISQDPRMLSRDSSITPIFQYTAQSISDIALVLQAGSKLSKTKRVKIPYIKLTKSVTSQT